MQTVEPFRKLGSAWLQRRRIIHQGKLQSGEDTVILEIDGKLLLPVFLDLYNAQIHTRRTGNRLGAVPVDQRPYTAIQADQERMPLVDGCCDVVIANAGLHYARTPDRYLREIHRILKSDGVLIIMDSPVYPTQAGADQAYERTRAYYDEAGFPELAQHYGGLVEAHFDAQDLFHFQRLRRDFSRIDLFKKRFREVLGKPESARFPIWVGRKE